MGVTAIKSEKQYKEIVESTKPNVIMFLAPWDDSSKAIAPKFKTLVERFPKADYFSVDICDQQDVAMTSGVKLAPTFRFYNQTKLIKEIKTESINEVERTLGAFLKEAQ
ncbi:hypothetical protein OIO90_005536 [Microbotryomycetes sp. JL221]|nr:hypothetical protein OIO90_005536 [Microbotryomycetes sp. JL221]